MHKKKAARIGALLMSCMISATVGTAQYNKTFETDADGLIVSGASLDIAPAGPYSQCVLSNISQFPKEYGFAADYNLINFKRVDNGGNTFWDRTYQTMDENFKFQPSRLIRTSDGGFIATGRIVTPDFINPCAIKVDSTGTLEWNHLYYSNTTLFDDQPETAISRVTDDSSGVESYIIVRTGVSDDWQHPYDVTVNALRIQANGQLIWNRKYNLGDRNFGDKIVKDYPRTVTEVPDSTGNFYFIAGTRLNQDSSGHAIDSSLFFMGIDKDGHITRAYRHINIKGIPKHQDALFDTSRFDSSIVLSYTHANSRLVNNNRSQIGVMKLDKSLNIKMMNYYYAQGIVENQAARISLNAANNAYVIACNTKDSLSYYNENIALLKLNKAGTPVFYNNYNIARHTKANSILKIDSSAGPEYYHIVGLRESDHYDPSTGDALTDKRLLKTDASGNACGVNYLNPRWQSYRDTLIFRGYYETDADNMEVMEMQEIDVLYLPSNCDSANAPYFKNGPVKATAVQQAVKVTVYPTLLQSGDQQLNIATMLTEHTGLNATLYSIDGRKVATMSFNPGKGNAVSQWPLQQLNSGTYVVHVVNSKGTIQEQFRITKL